MDVLSKIDRGELVLAKTKGWSVTTDFETRRLTREIERLARLGAAAEKGFDIDCNFSCRKIYGGNRCEESLCAWEDFCKLRSEEGAG